MKGNTRKDQSVRLRDAAESITPAILAILILVDVIAQKDNEVYRVLSHCISKHVEETVG